MEATPLGIRLRNQVQKGKGEQPSRRLVKAVDKRGNRRRN